MNDASDREQSTSSPLLVAVAWLIVLIPLAYGLIQTIIRAANLFTG